MYPTICGLRSENPDAPLLAEQDLTQPAIDAFRLMFEQFASNEDGTMSIDDMTKYIIHCCGEKEESALNNRVHDIFDQYGTETGAVQDRLSCEGFLNFIKYPVLIDLIMFGMIWMCSILVMICA